jgi:hypothetical protein
MGSVTAADPTACPAGSGRPAANHSPRSAMRIVRPQPAGLRCRVRLADGRVFHRRAATRPPPGDPAWDAAHRCRRARRAHPRHALPRGKLALDRRRRPEHYLAGGAAGRRDWLAALLAHAEQIVRGAYATRRSAAPREEVFVGVAPRTQRRGDKHAVAHSRFLWVDVDEPGELPALWALLAERPCHLLIESGGSGGAHAYWKLAEPLAATRVDPGTGEVIEPIEQANLRLIHQLGIDSDGRPCVADVACRERARVMRLAGTVNWKTGQHARVVEADFALPAYPLAELVGALPDPSPAPSADRRARRASTDEDPYKRITPPEYFRRLAGITVPRGGLVSCPAPAHDDRHPSCSVGAEASQGWCCHSRECGARGAIDDLASLLHGGPWAASCAGARERVHARPRARARGVRRCRPSRGSSVTPTTTRSPRRSTSCAWTTTPTGGSPATTGARTRARPSRAAARSRWSGCYSAPTHHR